VTTESSNCGKHANSNERFTVLRDKVNLYQLRRVHYYAPVVSSASICPSVGSTWASYRRAAPRPLRTHSGGISSRGGGGRGCRGGGMRPGRYCAGAAFGGAKYGILKSGHFCRIIVRIAERIRREFALHNYNPNLAYCS